ncbi:hypothetical protein ACWDZ8_24260 [Streptomyces sp. NPDC003233]
MSRSSCPPSATKTAAWPHEPAAVDYHTTEGRSLRNWLSDDAARVARLPAPGTMPAADEAPDAADASARDTANELSSPCTAVFRWTP